MKLHLPKQLFTALLTAITLAAAPAVLTLGSAAWGADQTLIEDITWDAANTTTAGESDTIFVGSGDGGTNKEIKLTIADGADITAHMLALRRGGDVQITGGTLTLNRLHIHNHNQYTGKELFELSGGVVTVNGGDDFTNSATGSRTAITIGHWGGGSGRLLVSGGTLNSLNGSIYMGYDSSAELEITGGTVNAKGFYYRTDVNRTSSVILNGGRLNIGTQGINNSRIEDKGNRTVTLTSGTLGVLDAAGWILQNVNTTIGNITIDTNVWDAATGATATGDAAGSANISLLGDLVAQSADSSITLSGSGSLTIDHTWDGALNLANDATAKVLINTGDMSGFDAVSSGEYGDTQASGFATYQIFNSGSTASVYSTTDKDNALTLTAGAYSTSDFHVHDTVNYADIDGTVSKFYVQSTGTLHLAELEAVDGVISAVPAPIQNSGNVSIAAGTNGVTLNDLFGTTAITQTATGTTTITGAGAISMDAALSASGTVKISNAASFANNEKTLTLDKLVLENVSEAIINGSDSSSGKVSGTIEVLGKSMLILTGKQDLLGWSDGDYTDKILLRGTDAENKATLQLNTRQTCSTAIVMGGYSTILNGGNAAGNDATDNNAGTLQMHNGGSITATGTDNTFSAILYTNIATTIAVTGAGDKLLIDGVVRGNNEITKTGDGTLTFSGDMSRQSGAIKVNDGIVVLDDAATLGSSAYVVASGAELQVSGVTRETFSNAVSGAGTLTKTGAGTLTLTNATAVNLNVAGGKLVYELADNAEAAVDKTLGSLVVSSGAAFEKTGAGTLNVGNLHSATLGGDIVVSDGVLQFNGYGTDTTTEDYVVVPPRFVQLVQNLTTTGTGKVDITGRVSFNWTGDHAGVRGCTIGSYISVEDDLQMNSHASNADADGDAMCRWEVVSGGTLEVGDVLWLTNKQKLVVDGGAVTAAGGVHLGHNENNGDYYSKIAMKSGSLTTQNITLIGNNNAVQMTGGTITFTPAADGGEVLIDGDTSSSSAGAGTLDFAGGTLAATTNSWTLTGTSAMAVSLGNVEFNIAAGKTVTLAGIYNLTGTLDLTGNTVTEGENTTTGTLALAGTMTVTCSLENLKRAESTYTNPDGTTSTTGNGFYTGKYYLVENADAANISTTGLTVMMGSADVTTDVSLSETGKHLIVAGSSNGVFYVNNTAVATTEIAETAGFAHYRVEQGATLSITQSEASLSDSNAKSALLSATGSGTIVYANAANDTLICGTGMSDQFTGTLDLSQGTIYVGNKPNTSVLDNSGGDTNFDASRVIVRADGAFWTHLGEGSAESGKIFAAGFDLMNGAELNNRDGHVHYTGDIRFNVENPAAADSGFSSNGVVSLRQYWGKTLEYSGLLSGDGTVQMYATTASAQAGADDTKAFYKLSGADNTFRGTYELVNSTDSVQRTTTLILANATAAQYATVKLSSTDSLAVLQLNQSATIKGLYSTDADNKVTTTAAATLTVSEGDFAGKIGRAHV